MTITIRNSNFKTLKPNDFGFKMTDGIVVAQRAGFEIDEQCPNEYKLIIVECMNRGWLKPIAIIRDYELTREILN